MSDLSFKPTEGFTEALQHELVNLRLQLGLVSDHERRQLQHRYDAVFRVMKIYGISEP